MEVNNNNPHKNKVHKILAHSYTMYFILFLVGVTLDVIFKFKIFKSPVMTPLGIFLLVIATLLILWAQTTSRDLTKQNISKETFLKGPYRYTRNPTHWGLFILMLGFGIMTNAFFLILSTFVSFVITKFVFLKDQERVLALKYGAPYLEYKKQAKF